MTQNLSLLVDPFSTRTLDPSGGTLGWGGPRSQPKMVWALPTDPSGPSGLEQPTLLVDESGFAWGDPSGSVIGQPGVTIHRLLTAGRVQGTR